MVGNDEGEREGGRQEGRGQGVEGSDGGEGVVNSEGGGQRMVGSEGGEGVDAYHIEYNKMMTTLLLLSLSLFGLLAWWPRR